MKRMKKQFLFSIYIFIFMLFCLEQKSQNISIYIVQKTSKRLAYFQKNIIKNEIHSFLWLNRLVRLTFKRNSDIIKTLLQCVWSLHPQRYVDIFYAKIHRCYRQHKAKNTPNTPKRNEESNDAIRTFWRYCARICHHAPWYALPMDQLPGDRGVLFPDLQHQWRLLLL